MRISRQLVLTLVATLLTAANAFADEAAIRRNIAERLPDLPKIDEINKSPVAGIYEVRFNATEILYTNETGEYIFVGGSLVDTKTRQNLTESRTEKLLLSDFDKLPLQDAIVIRQGSGQRRMAIFVDPNCPYCRTFEKDLETVKDVTVYAFVIPILGDDSKAKARDIWCSKDPAVAWRAWMLGHVAPMRAMGCDAQALERNVVFARQQRIAVTPFFIFADGMRKSGVMTPDAVEGLLAAASSPTAKK